MKNINNKMRAVDLFAGAGGFSLAALNIGVNLLAAVELDIAACQTYKKNIVEKRSKKTKLFNSNILELSPVDFRKKIGLKKGELELLIGGPPCQGFSSHRFKDSGVGDPRNSLLIRYFDFVAELKPKIFLIENVPGLLWKRHELYLQKFKKLSKKEGYKLIGPEKINAKNFGVPQNRNRVFIIGVRDDVEINNSAWPPKATHYKPGTCQPEWKNASEVFGHPTNKAIKKLKKDVGEDIVNGLVYGEPVLSLTQDPTAIHMNHTPELIIRFSETPVNGGREDISFRLKCHDNNYGGHKDVYGRIRLAQPGPTITTGCFNPSKGRFLHPWKNHGITVRHAARFQTFPEDYIFAGGITHQGQQVGNAVPVKLGEIVISSTLSLFADAEKDTIDSVEAV